MKITTQVKALIVIGVTAAVSIVDIAVSDFSSDASFGGDQGTDAVARIESGGLEVSWRPADWGSWGNPESFGRRGVGIRETMDRRSADVEAFAEQKSRETSSLGKGSGRRKRVRR